MQKAFRTTTTAQIGGLSAKKLTGFYVASTNAGTLVLRDGDSGGDVKSGTITPAVGFHPFPVGLTKGLHATIAGTALDVTFFVDE